MVFYNSWNEIGWLRDIPAITRRHLEIFTGDIRDIERVRQGVGGCEYVFHLSSLIAIPYSYDASRSYVDTNILGALNVLQACRESSTLIRLVHVSTSEVYGTAQQIPIPESHPLVGQSPYSATKIAADKLAESFHRSFGLPVVIARPFNTYGHAADGPRRDTDDCGPAACRGRRAQAWLARAHPRLQLRHRYCCRHAGAGTVP
jgi:dTDP-glucose 4,6-dehydratase